MPETKSVVTIKRAYYNDILYEAGVTLEVPARIKGKWFVDADAYVPEVPEEVEPEPDTLSGLANQPVKAPARRGRPPKARE